MRNLAKLWYAGIFTQNKSQNCDVKLVLPQHFLPAHVYPGRLLPMLQLSFQSSFWTSPRIQETYFRWAPCSERRSDQEVEGEEDVQVGRKHWWSFIWRCSLNLVKNIYLLSQGHNCGLLWGKVLQPGDGYFQVISEVQHYEHYDKKNNIL